MCLCVTDCVQSVRVLHQLCALCVRPDFMVPVCWCWLCQTLCCSDCMPSLCCLCTVCMLSLCCPGVCCLWLCAVYVYVCCLCVCSVCVLSVWQVSLCYLSLCCPFVSACCEFVLSFSLCGCLSVYVLVLWFWFDWLYTLLIKPIIQRIENLVFYIYIYSNLNHHTATITYFIRIWNVQVFCKGRWWKFVSCLQC